MNKQLLFQYRNLERTDRESIQQRFGESDKMTRLVGFLSSQKGDDFSTVKAIGHVYKEEIKSVTPEILTNRYYKLRKKLKEILSSCQAPVKKTSSGLLIPEEELEFLNYRLLIHSNDISGAVKNLKALLKKCTERELYEILPDICNQIIYCNQLMNLHHQNPEIMENALLFIKRNDALQKQKILLRRAQHEYMTTGFTEAGNTLKEIKNESDRFPESKRLRMNYHWGSLIIGSSSFANSTHALSRHMKQVESYIISGKPFLNYIHGHQHNDRFHLNLIKGSFGFLLHNYEMCYEAFRDCFLMMEKIPSLQSRKSEPLYLNKIFIDIITKRYNEALQTASELERFIRSQRLKERLGMVWIQRMRIYLFAYPRLKSGEYRTEIKNALDFLKELKKQGQNNLVDEYQLFIALYYFQNGEFKESKKYFNSLNVKNLLIQRGIENKEISHFINSAGEIEIEEKNKLLVLLRSMSNSEKNIENKLYFDLIKKLVEQSSFFN